MRIHQTPKLKSYKRNADLNKSGDIQNALSSMVESLQAENVLNIDEFVEAFIEELCVEGEKYARQNCPVDKGDLISGISHSVKVNKNSVVGKVVCKSDHAAFVEFGTGVVGASVPYPEEMATDKEGKAYVRNVPSQSKDATGGWHYYKDGAWHYTHGMKPRPFMFNTAKYMENVAPKIARRIVDDN